MVDLARLDTRGPPPVDMLISAACQESFPGECCIRDGASVFPADTLRLFAAPARSSP